MALYIRKGSLVDAIRLSTNATMYRDKWVDEGEIGDWLVTFDNGGQEIIPGATFKEEYENVYFGRLVKTHMKKDSVLWALQLVNRLLINTKGPKSHVRQGIPGCWLTLSQIGCMDILTDEEFKKAYEPF